MEAPKPRKSSSKKNKKSWRLNSDVGEVEDFLEDRRLEERLGGSFDARKDVELFVVDTVAPKEESKTKDKNNKEKPLKCFSSLENHSAIQDPVRVRNHVKTPAERENPIIKHLRKKDKLKDKIAKVHRDSHAIKKSAQKAKPIRRSEFDFDLWESGEVANSLIESEWVGPESRKQAYGNTRVKAPKTVSDKTSELPAVELPRGGSSYNPSLQDHKDHIWRTALTEIKKEKDIRRIEKHTTDMFPSRRLAGLDPDMDKDDSDDEETLVDGEIMDDVEIVGSGEMHKLKTRKQRKKERSSKAALRRRVLHKSNLSKEQSIFRLKTFKKELDSMDNQIVERTQKRSAAKEHRRKFEPLKLGHYKYEEMEEPVKLTEELT
ncbi:Ribosome biogenesis protein NOP53, partial [Caligus rogercresseyi]